jgi:hypothetical protein
LVLAQERAHPGNRWNCSLISIHSHLLGSTNIPFHVYLNQMSDEF